MKILSLLVSPRLFGRLASAGMFGLLGVVMLYAQAFSPYSDFQAMNLEDLKTLQVKLTYTGPQQEPTPTIAFTSSFGTLDLTKFEPFRRAGFNYGNDSRPVQSFAASPAELQALIQNVGGLASVTAGTASGDFLSFALLNTVGGTKAFEAILNKTDSFALFGQLRSALASNSSGLRTLSEMACTLDLQDAQRPVDVTGQIQTSISGARLNRNTGRFVGTATATNNGPSLVGPVSLVIDLAGGVTLFNADGVTCTSAPVGRSFINLPLQGNTLPAGGSVTVNLDYLNGNTEPIKATTKVLAGPGAR